LPDSSVTRHADAVLRVALGTPGQVELSDAIGGSWRRCVNDYALDPVRAHEPAVVTGTALKDRVVQHEHLIQIASAEMDVLYDQIAGSGYALLLTDATGIILCERVSDAQEDVWVGGARSRRRLE
jgi:transcriptional regulator of acetoin/glycerol metabolism